MSDVANMWTRAEQDAYIEQRARELAALARRGNAAEGRGWIAIWPDWVHSRTGGIGDKWDYWTQSTMPQANACLLETVRTHDPTREYVIVFVFPDEDDDESVLLDWRVTPLLASFAVN